MQSTRDCGVTVQMPPNTPSSTTEYRIINNAIVPS
jgi:hypothetical protein